MGMIPLEELKWQWGQDLTSEQAIGYMIQHMEAFNALVKEKGHAEHVGYP